MNDDGVYTRSLIGKPRTVAAILLELVDARTQPLLRYHALHQRIVLRLHITPQRESMSDVRRSMSTVGLGRPLSSYKATGVYFSRLYLSRVASCKKKCSIESLEFSLGKEAAERVATLQGSFEVANASLIYQGRLAWHRSGTLITSTPAGTALVIEAGTQEVGKMRQQRRKQQAKL
jgi:hypothetical protein